MQAISLLIFLTLFIFSSAALPCTQDSDCTSVTVNLNFVTCDRGQCRCLHENGFSGRATVYNRCDCSLWNDIARLDSHSESYCYDLTNLLVRQKYDYYCQIVKSKLITFYSEFQSPSVERYTIAPDTEEFKSFNEKFVEAFELFLLIPSRLKPLVAPITHR
jgi:hypothetical protein